jgi:hypothetical protein
MKTRKISTYYADNQKGYAEVHVDFVQNINLIKYFDNEGLLFFTEDFPQNSINYVEDAAENWALGIKKLGEELNV